MKILYSDGHVDECPKELELEVLRHSAAHIMAQAVKRLYPEARFAYGPATEKGFHYDIDLGDRTLRDDELAPIEDEMRRIVAENLPFKVFSLPREEAVKLMQERGEVYKVEHIGDLPADAAITFYQQGEHIDMCAGPHITYTKALKAVKLTTVSGAYWKNNAENKMLTRLNGVAFRTKEELAEYEREAAEARSRDHRRIGREMKLFMTDDLVGKGLPMFLPKGYAIWQQLEDYIKEKERRLGYQHVLTPCLGTVGLYETSGHWAHYKENMFPVMEVEDEKFV
ncbi:MAG: threonine--tRNA ligase, partial [Pyramidobacter sp.]|nr:threonine--tRNA ligase [Pyramidobacter sp.]